MRVITIIVLLLASVIFAEAQNDSNFIKARKFFNDKHWGIMSSSTSFYAVKGITRITFTKNDSLDIELWTSDSLACVQYRKELTQVGIKFREEDINTKISKRYYTFYHRYFIPPSLIKL